MIVALYFVMVFSLLYCALIAFMFALEFAYSGQYGLCLLEVLLSAINGGTATAQLSKLLK